MTAQFDPQSTRVPLPGTNNVRDLGGYPATDGRAVVRGRVYRSEALARPGADEVHAIWDQAHAEHFKRLDLRTVLDLRAPREIEITPSAWDLATGARVMSMPILEGGEGSATYVMGQLMSGERKRFGVQDMVELYRATIARQAKVFGEIVRVLANPDTTPTLVHCSAGKDRTGIAVALVLDVLGVDRDLVVQDYALTGQFRPNRVNLYVETFEKAGLRPDDVRVLFETPAEAMEATLAHVDEEYGGTRSYFIGLSGLGPSDLEALHHNLLGPAAE